MLQLQHVQLNLFEVCYFLNFSLLPTISGETVCVINVGCVNTRLKLMCLALLKHSIGEGLPHSKLDGFDFGKGVWGGFAEPMPVLHKAEKLCWHC